MYQRIVGSIQELSYIKVSRGLLMAFLITFPFQVKTLIFNMPYFPTGGFNEFASFFLYLSDLLLIGSFIAYGVAVFKGEVKQAFHYGYMPFTFGLILLLLLFTGTIFWSEFPLLSLWQVFRFGELFLLYLLVVNAVLNRHEVLRFFLYGILAQSFVALGQYLFQSSVGLRFLGEPIVGPDVPGVAKVDWNGMKVLRSYGTFTHPNVFGGVVAIALLWTYYLFRKNTWVLVAVGTIFLMALLFTFSRSAFLALAGGVLVLFSLSEKKIKVKQVLLWSSIVLLLVVLFNLEGVLIERVFLGNDAQSGIERLQYMSVSKGMMLDHPFGVGLGHFTFSMQDYISVKLSPWLMQPVHNAFLLLMNEVGIVTGLFFVALLGFLFFSLLRIPRKIEEDERLFVSLSITVLTVIMIISLFDHYFVTLYQGQVMLFVYFALASSALNASLLPRKKS